MKEKFKESQTAIRWLFAGFTLLCLLAGGWKRVAVYDAFLAGAKEGLETARRILPRRANSLFLGGFEGTKIVGYTSRFSHMESSLPPLFTVEKGLGRSESAAVEGIRSGGVLGTYLLGPLLVLNPDFTRWLLDDLGAGDAPLAFEDEVRRAYRVRLEQFQGNIEV